jgi:hypothetical protein
MIYSIYTIDGRIQRIVGTSDIDLQLQSGERFLEGEYSDDAYYVLDGIPVAIPPKTSQHHIFDYATKQWIDPRTPDTEWPLVRSKRDRLLQASDWTQLPDVPLATKEAWAAYRQALRDITEQLDPFNIIWPELP